MQILMYIVITLLFL